MRWPWILSYTIGTRHAGGYRIVCLLSDAVTPTYTVFKVVPLERPRKETT